MFKHLDIAKMLLEKGASIDIQNIDGWTALIWASRNGNIDIVETLLESGANVSIQDNNGRTFMDHLSEDDKDDVQQVVDRISGTYIKG